MDSTPEFLRAKYESVELIGEGGDGRVYKCQRGERVTAVKTLVALDLASQTRFLSEANILLQIDHENIVKVFEAGKTDGCFWYESEHANEGHFGTMHGYILQSDLDRANYFGQICLGVQALHNLNPPIIHRDLKPRNILVFSNAEPRKRTVLKIADFGLAVIAGEEGGLTTTGDALGTGDYMAPECKANPLIRSPRSDIYSLGITFLEACTGKTDVSQENLNLVPELFRPMIGKMIQQHPNHRYQSVVEVIDALSGFSFLRLLYGRELLENEVGTPVFHINIGRELENALGTFFTCDSSNVLERLAFLERLLDRLYDASDHEAHTIITIPRNGVALTDQVKPDALLSLVRRSSMRPRILDRETSSLLNRTDGLASFLKPFICRHTAQRNAFASKVSQNFSIRLVLRGSKSIFTEPLRVLKIRVTWNTSRPVCVKLTVRT